MKRFSDFLAEAKQKYDRTTHVEVYHGSKSKFHDFDPTFLHGGHDQRGPGLYTTTDMGEAHNYGQHLHTMRIDPSKFIHPGDKPKKSIIADLVKRSPHLEDQASNWHENKAVGTKMLIDHIHKFSDSMHEAMEKTWYDAYKGDNHAFLENVSDHFHGTMVHPNKFNHEQKHYVIWSGKAIKGKISHDY